MGGQSLVGSKFLKANLVPQKYYQVNDISMANLSISNDVYLDYMIYLIMNLLFEY